MDHNYRFQYALEHVTSKSVFIVERADWESIVDGSGEPVKLVNVPSPISGLVSMAAHIITAGSGIYNPSPGIDVVRFDPADRPYIYNIDHYIVFENFDSSPIYSDTLKVYNCTPSKELDEYIHSHVFVVGPYQVDENHWCEEIPEKIRLAKVKD